MRVLEVFWLFYTCSGGVLMVSWCADGVHWYE
jgi:hypothetical protein